MSICKLVAALWLLNSVSNAQAQPLPGARTLPQNIISSNSLTAQDRQQIAEYVNMGLALMTANPPKIEDVERARQHLLQPFTAPGVSLAFREDYSQAVVPPLAKLVPNANMHLAVNALGVLANLGTSRAMDVLLHHANKDGESRWQIRLRAAAGCLAIIEARTLPPNRVVAAARRLRDAAANEDHSYTLLQQLTAIDRCDHTTLSPSERAQVRDLLVTAVSGAVDSLTRRGNLDQQPLMLEAIVKAVAMVRTKFLDQSVPQTEKLAMGKKIAPSLAQVLNHVNNTWDRGRADESTQRVYNSLVTGCESFMELIEKQVQPQQRTSGQLRGAWETGNRQQYEAGLKNWQDTLATPPYRR
jgi:hypothetical protein